MSKATPKDLTISPRDYAFGRDGQAARWWLGGDPVATAFYDALSATFPQGERFFMDAVRRYRQRAAPELAGQIAAFLSQEAMHTREHIFFNRQIAANGFDVAAMEARTKAILDFARTQEPLKQLAATAALEHFTAILAHAVLTDPRHLAGAPDEARDMWRWHAVEEIEHKAVAFDTFAAASGGLRAPRRWLLRAASMIVATRLLFTTVGANMGEIFAAGGLDRRRAWRRAAGFLLARPGILRQVAGAYLAYFLPGFHPWKRDDRALAARAAATLGRHAAQAAA
ncbi:MAG TPA: metal-dependent hydrolase [Caulobacteraceae bacterium]|nr:metal-dependent hydrolase [Caulobacteraceae bacterium]